MNQAIGESITFAIGVAISPLPIIAIILMLLSRRTGPNSLAFLIGWMVGIAAVLVAVLAIGAALGLSTGGSNTADGTSTFKLVLGIILVVLGLRRIRQRPAQGESPAPPKWLTSVEDLSTPKAGGLGFALAAVNPKNLVLIIGGGTTIAQTSTSVGQRVVAVAIFVVLGSLTIGLPVLMYALARAKATPILDRWRNWLGAHASATVGAVILVLGVLLIGKGVGGF